jgi:hypothetical protein
MNTRIKVPQMAGVRQSVEVKQGSRGVGRMLRRGLHGAKNWTLELDENGEHRSVWSKGFRALVVLLPFWIVLSATTGGPERGGQSVGAFQSVVGALVVLLVGLSVFSARERRLGREEPWQGDGADESDGTESDDDEPKTLVESSPEEGEGDSDNPQVTESESAETDEIEDDDSEISTEITQIERPDLQKIPQQATSPEPETVVIPALEAPTAVLPQAVQQATTVGANQEDSVRSFEAIASVVEEFRQEDVRQASPESAYSLVKDDATPVQSELRQATPEWTDVDVSTSTESNDGAIQDEPTTRLRDAVQADLQEDRSASESPQVSLEKEAVQQPLQGVLQVQFATPGPYPTKGDPVHEGWWIVAPDIEPEGEESEVVTAVEPAESEPVAVPPQEIPVGPTGGRHPLVLSYFASQAPKSGFTAEEKERARTDVIAWVRDEIGADRLSRAEASRVLGVDPSTVTRWLSDDPWAG